jgi:hypothetical protein
MAEFPSPRLILPFLRFHVPHRVTMMIPVEVPFSPTKENYKRKVEAVEIFHRFLNVDSSGKFNSITIN